MPRAASLSGYKGESARECGRPQVGSLLSHPPWPWHGCRCRCRWPSAGPSGRPNLLLSLLTHILCTYGPRAGRREARLRSLRQVHACFYTPIHPHACATLCLLELLCPMPAAITSHHMYACAASFPGGGGMQGVGVCCASWPCDDGVVTCACLYIRLLCTVWW